jgi:manganese/zinc/iron transport system permease protein
MNDLDLLRLITLQDSTTRTVLLGTGTLGLVSGVVGAFAMLRRRGLVADAVAHAALPGICVAFLIVGSRQFGSLLLGALVFGALAAWAITLIRGATRVKEDAAIGIVIGAFFGLGIAMSGVIQRSPGGNKAGLDGFIFGKAASMVRDDALLIAGVCAGVLLIVVLLYKELKLLCFDEDFGASQGWPTLRLDLLLMLLVCVCTVAGLPAVGVVLMVALMIIPPAAARLWTNRLGPMVLLSGLIGGASGLAGTAMSAVLPAPGTRGWPTGPLIVLCAACVFVVSLLLGKARGVIPGWLGRRRIERTA